MSLYDEEKEETPEIPLLGRDPERPKPDSWYIKMMMKRLLWPKCEDRETVIGIFKKFWPVIADRAEEFHDEAVKIIQAQGS